MDYIREIPKSLGDIVVSGYVIALRASFGTLPMVILVCFEANSGLGVVLVFSLTGLTAGLFLRERRL